MIRTITTLSVGLLTALAPLAPEAVAQDKPGTTAAPFLLIGTDARGAAMGSAQTAVASGAAALHWNPAGIANAADLSGGTATFSTQEWLLPETQHSFAGVTLNSGALGTFGLSVTAIDYGEERVTTVEQPEGTGEFYGATDLAVGLSYARSLTQQFSIGGTAKFVRNQLWNESATTGAIDLGVRYATDFRGIVIGASMTNFGGDMQLSGRDLRRRIDNNPETTGDNDDLPGSLEVDEWPLPLAFRVGISATPIQAGDVSLMVTAEGQAPSDNSQSASFGGEAAWRDMLFVRGGYRQAFSTVGEDAGWALGFGLAYDISPDLGLRFDYVFQEYEPFGTPQMFSLGVTF
ncbi:MAG: PorV/PorQ family protein [Bacteroidota bacterium]